MKTYVNGVRTYAIFKMLTVKHVLKTKSKTVQKVGFLHATSYKTMLSPQDVFSAMLKNNSQTLNLRKHSYLNLRQNASLNAQKLEPHAATRNY